MLGLVVYFSFLCPKELLLLLPGDLSGWGEGVILLLLLQELPVEGGGETVLLLLGSPGPAYRGRW